MSSGFQANSTDLKYVTSVMKICCCSTKMKTFYAAATNLPKGLFPKLYILKISIKKENA